MLAKSGGVSVMKGKMGLQGVVDNHTVDDALYAKGWDVQKRAQRGQVAGPPEGMWRAKRKLLKNFNFLAFLSARARRRRIVRTR